MSYKNRTFIDAFLSDPDEERMRDLVAYFQYDSPTDLEILLLAEGLANSGQKIHRLNSSEEIYDIPSTGGPTSLSTLLCPLFLAMEGKTVLKLGVPGRPAGGIDVLSLINGYNISPNIKEIHSWLKHNRYVHFIANNHYTPLDAMLFKFRKENDAINIPSLAIASLLSKKIAVGINHVGLDVRVSPFGNFGKTWEEATENAIRFNKVADAAGIRSKCFLNNGSIPQQPYIGRGESILALQKVFTGTTEVLLMDHVNTCFKMASLLCNTIEDNYPIELVQSIFFDNIQLQGGSPDMFEEIAFNTNKNHDHYVEAWKEGYLKIDLEIVRSVILNIQNKCSGIFPDPCGLILIASANDYLSKGDTIFSFRCIAEYKVEFEVNIKRAFSFSNAPIFHIKEFEEITHGEI